MKDEDKTKEQLINELAELRQRIAELGASETERKRVERALRESEERYRSLFEGAEDHIFVADQDFRYVAVNASALKTGGFILEDVVGKGPHELFPEDAEFYLSQYRRTFETGKPVRFERGLGLPDGLHWFSVTLSPIKDARGQVIALTGISRDITERKWAEEALHGSEAELSAIFDNAPIVMILLDQERRVRKVNRGALEFTGRSAEEMIGLHGGEALRCLHSLDDPEGCGFGPFCEICTVRNTVLDTFETGESHHRVEANLPFARGEEQEELTFLASTAPLSLPKGQMVLVCMEDITERKRAEEALQQRNRELELLHRASRAFGSSLDLDQVLATILEEVRQLSGAVASSVWLIDPETGELVCQQATGLKSEVVRGWRLAPGEGIVGWVACHGGSLIVPDTQADERYFSGIDQQTGLDLRSILSVPLRVKQNVIGVLEVMDTEVGHFNPTHLTLLELLAASAAIAIENARLFEQEREQRELAEALEEAAAAVSSTLDLDRVLDRILEQVEQVVAGDAFSVILIEDDAARVARRRGYELPGEEKHPSRYEIPITKYPSLMKMTQTGKPVVVLDTSVASDWVPAARDRGWRRSYVGAPIQVGGATVGFLNVSGTQPGQFRPDDARRLEAFASHAATAIENARLYEQARQDAETRSMLLHEVNHRVKNNLSAIIGLLYAEQRYAGMEDPSAYRDMIEDLANRIRGLARVHNMLSAAEWAPLPLDELTRQIIYIALRMLPRDKHVSVDVTPSPVRVTPKEANSLALVINELATNTVKYVLPERHTAHIGVCIALEDDTVLFEFRDDGPGYPEEVLQLERQGVGVYLVQTMVREGLGGELALHNDGGAVTTIRFKKDLLNSRNSKGLR